MMFDARTGFILISLLSLVISVALWGVLSRWRTRSLDLWCAGGLAAALASLLLALRDLLPDLLGYTGASLCAFLMLLLKLQAIRWELGVPEPTRRLALRVLVFLIAYEGLRLGASESWRYGVLLALFLLLNAWVAGWALRLGRCPGRGSANWIAAAFALMAVIYGVRLANAALGGLEPGIMVGGRDALLLALGSVLGVVVSNLAWFALCVARAKEVGSGPWLAADERTLAGAGPGVSGSSVRGRPGDGSAKAPGPSSRGPVTVDEWRLAERRALGRVVLIDREALGLAELRARLEAAGYACETYDSVLGYLQSPQGEGADVQGPCCVLCEVGLPEQDGLALQRRLMRSERTPIVLMGTADQALEAVNALRAGALDVLIKPVDEGQLLAVVAGALRVSAERMQRQVRRRALAARLALLTPREQEVAQRVASGQRNHEVAEALGIGLRTVKRHRHQVMEKLQVKTLADLVRVIDEARGRDETRCTTTADRRPPSEIPHQ